MANTDVRVSRPVRPVARLRGHRLVTTAVWAAIGGVLFACYLGLSGTYPENSDEANLVLMAHDMLNGNPLLHGWYVSDVSFFTYDLPQLAVVQQVFGWTFTAAHVSVALTFTFVVLVGALLARGPRPGDAKAGVARMLVAGGIMFAPQPGVAVFVLLLSIGHIGTAVPVMLAWLVADRLGERWYVPVIVALLLGWAAAGDSLVLVIGIWPLMLVSLVRIVCWLWRGGGRLSELRTLRWFEPSLLAAGAGAWLLSALITFILRAAGAYNLSPLPYTLHHLARDWWLHVKLTASGVRMLFGVDPASQHGGAAILAWLHVVGLALAVAGIGLAARRFLSWPGDLISQLLLVGIVANLAAYIPSSMVTGVLNVREVAPVLPMAAVLAGRQLGGPLAGYVTRLRSAAVVAGLILVGYAASLIIGALGTTAPVPYTDLAARLEAAHLSYGFGGYWQSSVITVETQGKVTIRALTDCANMPYSGDSRPALFPAAQACLAGPPTSHGGRRVCEITPYPWETSAQWYAPADHDATFIVQVEDPARYLYNPRGRFNIGGALKSLGRTSEFQTIYDGTAGKLPFPPWRATYYIRIYHYNLLSKLPVVRSGKCT